MKMSRVVALSKKFYNVQKLNVSQFELFAFDNWRISFLSVDEVGNEEWIKKVLIKPATVESQNW